MKNEKQFKIIELSKNKHEVALAFLLVLVWNIFRSTQIELLQKIVKHDIECKGSM